MTWAMACWMTRSTTLGMPSARSPPPGFGIITRRTGLGLIATLAQGLADRRPVLAGVGREVFDAHAVDSRRAPVGLHPRPRPFQVGRRQYCFHQVFVQGWLGGTTPIPGSPGRVHRRVRVIHGSSLSIHVRPFAPCRRLLWPLLTSVRSRRKFLPVALCRVPVCRLFARMRRATRRSAWALMIQFRPFWNYGSARHRHARQISPGKNAMFPCASAAFTLSAVSDGLRHEVPTRPQTRPSMQFLSVASHVCTPASSRQALAGLPLPSASGYHRFMMNPCRYSHRGLSPHYTAPMLGAHRAFEPTAASGLRALAIPSALRASAAAQRERWASRDRPSCVRRLM